MTAASTRSKWVSTGGARIGAYRRLGRFVTSQLADCGGTSRHHADGGRIARQASATVSENEGGADTTGVSANVLANSCNAERLMKKGKTKLTRQDAERLFGGPARRGCQGIESARESVRSGGVRRRQARRHETRLWKDNLITLPTAIELPRGMTQPSHLREAMTRSLRVNG